MKRGSFVGVHPLIGITFGFVNFIKIYFLQVSFEQITLVIFQVDIMLVRWIAAPVAAGSINLNQQQAMDRLIL